MREASQPLHRKMQGWVRSIPSYARRTQPAGCRRGKRSRNSLLDYHSTLSSQPFRFYAKPTCRAVLLFNSNFFAHRSKNVYHLFSFLCLCVYFVWIPIPNAVAKQVQYPHEFVKIKSKTLSVGAEKAEKAIRIVKMAKN